MKALLDINVSLKRVFLRADLDVPLREAQVTNGERLTTNAELGVFPRLTNLKPTVDWLLEHGVSQIIIAGHIDRPTFAKATVGKPPLFNEKLSTKQLLGPLKKILGQEVVFSSQLENSVNREPTTDNRIILFENLRFWPGEVECSEDFARKLSGMADVYVNEAFGNCHRNHASMVGVPKLLSHAAGVHLEKEVEVLTHLLKNPQRPFIAIVGGAKVETKIPVIENLAKVADWVLIGGAIAKEAKQLSVLGSQSSTLRNEPSGSDSNEFSDKGQSVSQLTGQQRTDNRILIATSTNGKDIDEASVAKFKTIISTAKTIVWNGPMGVFEEGFEKGTLAVVEAISQTDAYKVVGGGETTQFLENKNLNNKFSFISAGGGAMLEFLAGKELLALRELE